LKNASIVDIFWGIGFIVLNAFYFFFTESQHPRKYLLVAFVTIWGLRLSLYIFWRNLGKGEDFRYQNFRQHYGPNRYWWFSFFQVFMLQGVLLWIISAPLLAVHYYSSQPATNFFDYLALTIWTIGFIFEAGGDWQLARFKIKTSNNGKLFQSGLWKYTRHPNYFGDATIWWAYSLFGFAAGVYWPVVSALLMTYLLLKVSGVAMIERTLKTQKPDYDKYLKSTSPFFPWFPKKN
jgi:steroid 5-alpha reductase family enzyme